jgi:hypothetical protein
MAHRPVGSATSLGITKTSTASTDFAVQSNVIRVNALQTLRRAVLIIIYLQIAPQHLR